MARCGLPASELASRVAGMPAPGTRNSRLWKFLPSAAVVRQFLNFLSRDLRVDIGFVGLQYGGVGGYLHALRRLGDLHVEIDTPYFIGVDYGV